MAGHRLGYCLMPTHFHLVIRTHADGYLGRWVRWLLVAHAQRYHRHYHTTGHVWQGRYKAFPVQDDDHSVGVLRYVERNALRAEMVPVLGPHGARRSELINVNELETFFTGPVHSRPAS